MKDGDRLVAAINRQKYLGWACRAMLCAPYTPNWLYWKEYGEGRVN